MNYEFPSSISSLVAAEASARALRNVFEHQEIQRTQMTKALHAMEAELKRRDVATKMAEAIALEEQVRAALERQRTEQAQIKLLSDVIAYRAMTHYYNQHRLLDEKALSEVSTAIRTALDRRMEIDGFIDRRRGEVLLRGLRHELPSTSSR